MRERDVSRLIKSSLFDGLLFTTHCSVSHSSLTGELDRQSDQGIGYLGDFDGVGCEKHLVLLVNQSINKSRRDSN